MNSTCLPRLVHLLNESQDSGAEFCVEDTQVVLEHIRESGEVDWVKNIEQRIADATGVSHVTLCGSRSIAMYVALKSIGITAGDEILLSSFSPVFIADVIRHFKAHPILVDVEKSSLEIDHEQVRDRLTDRSKAIIVTHLAGRPMKLAPLSNIANQYGLPIIEDVGAAAITVLGKSPGLRGQVICGAATEHAGRIVGSQLGYVCTNDHEAAQSCRESVSQSTAAIQDSQRVRLDCRPAQINAAWESSTLDTAQERWRRRNEIAMTYTAVFSGRSELEVPPESLDGPHSWTQYLLRLHLQRMHVGLKELVEQLRAAKISVGLAHLPIHMHPYYADLYGFIGETYPIARNEFLRTITLPIDHRISDTEVDAVATAVLSLL